MELSITRIGLLMKKQFIENKKLYLFGILAIIGIMSFSFLTQTTGFYGFRKKTQGLFLGIGMISFGCLFSLTLFSKLDTVKGRTQTLLLPATLTEKMISAILYGAVIFPIVYLATVYPLLRFISSIDNKYSGHFNTAYAFNVKGMQIAFLTIFYVLETIVLLLSVFFRQYKIVKSIVLIFTLFFGSIYVYPKIINQFLPASFKKKIEIEKSEYDEGVLLHPAKKIKVGDWFFGRTSVTPFESVQYSSNNHEVLLDIPPRQQNWFYILLYLSIPFIWLIIWFRLKESEIN